MHKRVGVLQSNSEGYGFKAVPNTDEHYQTDKKPRNHQNSKKQPGITRRNNKRSTNLESDIEMLGIKLGLNRNPSIMDIEKKE